MKLLFLSLLLIIHGCDCSIYNKKNNKKNTEKNDIVKKDAEYSEYVNKIKKLLESDDKNYISEQSYLIQQEFFTYIKEQNHDTWNKLLEKADANIIDNTDMATLLWYHIDRDMLLSGEQDKDIIKKYKIYKNTGTSSFTASRLFMDDDKINIENIKSLYEKGLLQEVLKDAGAIFKAKLSEGDDNELLKLASSDWVGASARKTDEKLYYFYEIKALPVKKENLENIWQKYNYSVAKQNILFLCLADDNMLKEAAEIIKNADDYKNAKKMLEYFYDIKNIDEKKNLHINFVKFYDLITDNFVTNYDSFIDDDKDQIIENLNALVYKLAYEDIMKKTVIAKVLNKKDLVLTKKLLTNKSMKDSLLEDPTYTEYVKDIIEKSTFTDQEKKELTDMLNEKS